MSSLLPINSTLLERALDVATAQQTPAPLRSLYDPDTCPEHLLPYLAWAWSVDRWDDAWPVATKREVIRASFYVHAYKGTLGALRRVVEPFGYRLEVVEWWQTEPHGEPGTFALAVGVQNSGITEQIHDELFRLIDDAKPVSRHLTGLDIVLTTPLACHIGVAVVDGDELDVYPWQSADIDVPVQGYMAVADSIIDEQDVYPWST